MRAGLGCGASARRGGSLSGGISGFFGFETVGVGFIQRAPVTAIADEKLFGLGFVDLKNHGDLIHIFEVDRSLAGFREVAEDRGGFGGGEVGDDGLVAFHSEGDFADGVFIENGFDLGFGEFAAQAGHEIDVIRFGLGRIGDDLAVQFAEGQTGDWVDAGGYGRGRVRVVPVADGAEVGANHCGDAGGFSGVVERERFGPAGGFFIGLEIGFGAGLRTRGKGCGILGGGVVDEREREEGGENETHGMFRVVAVRRAPRRNGSLARMIYHAARGVFLDSAKWDRFWAEC